MIRSCAGCISCGECSPIVLAFHHLDKSQKLFSIGNYASNSLHKLLAEVCKCVVVCHNCHAKLEHGYMDLCPWVKPLSPERVRAILEEKFCKTLDF